MTTSKTTLLLLLAVAAASIIFYFVQKERGIDVPDAVKTALRKQYPDAQNLKWEKEEENYEAEFKFNETEYSVVYDETGNTMETEIEIDTAQLPAAALEYVKTNFANQKIEEAAKITDAQGSITYEVDLKEMELRFDGNGSYVNKMED